MDSQKERIDRIVDTLTSDTSTYCPELPRACIRCLEGYQDLMGEQARVSLSVAKEYWDGRRTTEELTEARLQCWKAWDELQKRGREETVEAKLIRAVIFILFPPGFNRDSAYNFLDGFLEELDSVGPDYDRQLDALDEFLKARGLRSPD